MSFTVVLVCINEGVVLLVNVVLERHRLNRVCRPVAIALSAPPGGERAITPASRLNFNLSENVLLRKFSLKNKIWAGNSKFQILAEFRGKVESSSTRNLLLEICGFLLENSNFLALLSNFFEPTTHIDDVSLCLYMTRLFSRSHCVAVVRSGVSDVTLTSWSLWRRHQSL